jgi:hypothetical protein
VPGNGSGRSIGAFGEGPWSALTALRLTDAQLIDLDSSVKLEEGPLFYLTYILRRPAQLVEHEETPAKPEFAESGAK